MQPRSEREKHEDRRFPPDCPLLVTWAGLG
jgi:hypothetical protein